jgi:hypothetical protein
MSIAFWFFGLKVFLSRWLIRVKKKRFNGTVLISDYSYAYNEKGEEGSVETTVGELKKGQLFFFVCENKEFCGKWTRVPMVIVASFQKMCHDRFEYFFFFF